MNLNLSNKIFHRHLFKGALLSVITVTVLGGSMAAWSQTGQPINQSNKVSPNYPPDIDPKSGFRLPLPPREELDELAKKSFDRANTPGANIAGLHGPAGVRLYSPVTASHHSVISEYLRYKSGIPAQAREIAILATAREMDSQFEWVEHEPVALKAGVSQEIVDIIKFRRSTAGLKPADGLIIELGRQMWTDHKVKPELFAQLKEIYGPQKLIDITLLMGYYAGTAGLLSAVDMQLQPGKEALLPIPLPTGPGK